MSGPVIATISLVFFGVGFGLCVLAVAGLQARLMRRNRLNPFNPAHARDVLAGRYAEPDTPSWFSTGRGRLALALMGGGILGLLVALFVWALQRGA